MILRAVLVVGLVALAGCGGDDGATAPPVPTSATSATTVAPAPPSALPATTVVPAVAPGQVLGPPGGRAQRLDRQLGDGGPATAAELVQPGGLAIGPDGSLLIADSSSNLVRRVRPDGVIESIAGLPEEGPSTDGVAALDSPVLSPTDVAVAADGTVYVAADGRIRKITPAGLITTVAGVEGEAGFEPGGDGVAAVGEPLGGVGSIALAPDGSLLVSEQVGQIRRVTPAGVIELVAGTADYDEAAGSGDGGPATEAFLADNTGIAVGGDGAVYVAENSRVRRITPDGTIETLAGDDQQSCPPQPEPSGSAREAQICIPVAVATGPEGSVYFADGSQVFRIGADGSLDHVAGRADSAGFDGDGGPAVDAGLQLISDLAVAPDGTLFILDSCNHRVRRVGGDGLITTVAGSGPVCPEKEYGR